MAACCQQSIKKFLIDLLPEPTKACLPAIEMKGKAASDEGAGAIGAVFKLCTLHQRNLELRAWPVQEFPDSNYRHLLGQGVAVCMQGANVVEGVVCCCGRVNYAMKG